MNSTKILSVKQWAKHTLVWLACVALWWLDSQNGQGGEMMCWIPALVGGLISLGGSIASAAIGSKGAKQQAEAYDQAWANYEKWYEGQMNTSILDRADTLSMLRRLRENQEENARKFLNNAIKGGATEESKVAYAQKANEAYADAISQISAYGQQQKDRLSQQYAAAQLDNAYRRADAVAGGAQTSVNALMQGAGIIGDIVGGMDWGKKK